MNQMINLLGEFATTAQELNKEFNKLDNGHLRFNDTLYCMARENNEYTEDYFFFEVKNYDGETRISNDGDREMFHVIDPSKFDENFILVEKELFDLYQKASRAGETALIDTFIKLALYMDGLIEIEID